MSILEFAWVAGGIVAGAAAMWWFSQRTGRASTGEGWHEMERHIGERLDRVTEQINQRLRDNVQAMNESKTFLANRVSSTERTVREVSSTLGKLEHATEALTRTTADIANFQQLLRNPKIRGSFGEVLLGNLLGEMLPTDRFQLQFPLPSTGEIADAVVKLQDGYIVAIDAKFPLSNFEAFSQGEDEATRVQARSALVRDLKKHIVDISRKYISPQDRTLDYAFMYIPAESVYYETMMRDTGESLWDFCVLQHRIIPVSPNSLLAYLHTVLVGLRGMRVQEQAREILENLRQVRRDFQQFNEDFGMVGKHLTNAKNRFDDSARRLDKFSNRLEQVEGSSNIAAIPPAQSPE
jgi:DNA recombination protein RmuC